MIMRQLISFGCYILRLIEFAKIYKLKRSVSLNLSGFAYFDRLNNLRKPTKIQYKINGTMLCLL
jgi:hypothetical protein